MSKGDLIALRQDLEEQIEMVSRRYGGFAHTVQELQQRVDKLEKDLERYRMAMAAMSENQSMTSKFATAKRA